MRVSPLRFEPTQRLPSWVVARHDTFMLARLPVKPMTPLSLVPYQMVPLASWVMAVISP